jgi:hypothetical protein
VLAFHVSREILERPLTARADPVLDAVLDARRDATRGGGSPLFARGQFSILPCRFLGLFRPMFLASKIIFRALEFRRGVALLVAVRTPEIAANLLAPPLHLRRHAEPHGALITRHDGKGADINLCTHGVGS